MKLKVIPVILLLTLFTTAFADDITVPLYESQIQNYRVSQTIRHGVKWSSILALPTAAFFLHETRSNEMYVTTVLMLTSGTGAALGLLGGGIYGYVKGVQLNRKSGHHTQKYRFSHEIIIENDFRYAENITSYSLTYQTYDKTSLIIPTEYRLGYASRMYSMELLDFTEYNAEENKIYLDALFNSNRKIFQFHYGIGGGYSWGELEEEKSFESIKKEHLSGVFIYPLAGVTMNMYDFMYFRIEGKYELSSFYRDTMIFFEKPDVGMFGMSFSFGTYLF